MKYSESAQKILDKIREKLNKKGDSEMNKMTINGVSYEVPQGASLSINNGIVKVNGQVITSGLSGVVELKVEGDIGQLRTDASVSMNGDVLGDIDAGGSVSIKGNVKGNVDAGGSVSCGNVGGDVDAGGSISMKK